MTRVFDYPRGTSARAFEEFHESFDIFLSVTANAGLFRRMIVGLFYLLSWVEGRLSEK